MYNIYRRNDHNGKIMLVAEMDDLTWLFKETYSFNYECFSFCLEDRYTGVLQRWDGKRAEGWDIWKHSHYCYVVVNEAGTHLSRETLLGMRRKWVASRTYNYRQGRKKGAYAGLRHMRTTQEKKWAHAWDDEEFAPKPRAKRQGYNIPSLWDDYWAHNEKSWKAQSKRRHQWKQ